MHVVARRGGFAQALVFVLALIMFAGFFIAGIVFGFAATLMPAGPGGRGLPLEYTVRAGDSDKRVAIIAIEGSIDDAMSAEVARAVDYVLADTSFRSVVLRVDSPGGGVSPSDRIWREIGRLQEAGLPVVASYGGVAASGGVYVSCASDHIVCEETGITGSVGVIASVFTFGDLMEKIGVEPVTMVADGSPQKGDANDPYRRWLPTDKAVVQGLLDHSYTTFAKRVMTGRGSKAADPEKLRAALDGRIFTAEQAIEIGLIDSIGYLDDAITTAERLASLPSKSAQCVRLFEPAPLFGPSLLGQLRGHLRSDVARQPAIGTRESAAIRDAMIELSTPRLEYRWH